MNRIPIDLRTPAAWPTGTMAGLVIESPGRVGIADLAVPGYAPGAVLVRPRYVGLCGTDLELFHGTATYQRDGRAGYPHVFAHEWWGEVVAVADDVTGIAPADAVIGHTMVSCGQCHRCQQGRRQLCRQLVEVGLHGQQGAAADYIRMPAHALTRLPPPLARPWAVLVEPAVTVVEALNRIDGGLDDRIAVVGTGTVGLLAVQLASRVALRVEAVGVDPAGLDLALRCGAAAAYLTEDAPESAYSAVVEASGSPSGFVRSLSAVEVGGRVAVVGVANEPAGEVVPGDIALRGISVIGIQHGIDHYEQAIELFSAGVFDGECLVAGVLPARDVQDAFQLLEDGRSGPPKVILELTGSIGDRR